MFFGWCVVFPDIEFNVVSQEWEGPEILDRNATQNETVLAASINRMTKFWKDKTGKISSKKQQLTKSDIDSIALSGLTEERLTSIHREIADVQIYLFRLADVLDVDVAAAVREKMQINETRF